MITIGAERFEHPMDLKQFVRNLLGKYGPNETVSEASDQEFLRNFLAADPRQAGKDLDSISAISIVRNRKTKMTELALRYADGSEAQVSYMNVLANIAQ